jgi:hypothetical protein
MGKGLIEGIFGQQTKPIGFTSATQKAKPTSAAKRKVTGAKFKIKRRKKKTTAKR